MPQVDQLGDPLDRDRLGDRDEAYRASIATRPVAGSVDAIEHRGKRFGKRCHRRRYLLRIGNLVDPDSLLGRVGLESVEGFVDQPIGNLVPLSWDVADLETFE